MRTGLILVRHGETVDNAKGIAQGWGDSPLTNTGRQQVDRVARRLHELEPTSIWSSTLARALTTAEAIAEQLDLEIRPLDELKELNCGDWEGMPFHEVRSRDRDLYERWRSDPSVACPAGESFNDLAQRMSRAVERIVSEDARRPLIVSHGTAIRLVTCILIGLPVEVSYRLRQHNTAINVLDRRGDDYFLRTWNDSSHCFVEEDA